MRTILTADRTEMGRWVAGQAAGELCRAIESRGEACIVVATGSSQFEVLSELVKQDVPWDRVRGFHLDEYIGVASDHPASFCGYLKQRFVDQIPLSDFHFLLGDADPNETIARVGDRLRRTKIDLALVGIGENGHLAFNDPPADFETEDPYIIVALDQPCRQQQVGEGWFDSIDDVPTHAISMSVKQIMKSSAIICSVPDDRKAEAVRATIEDPISSAIPASILRRHAAATLVIDQAAASLLNEASRQNLESVS